MGITSHDIMPNRNETIAETLRALSSTPEFKEAGFTFEILDDLITRCEKLPKDDPNKIRKRSATRASKELSEGPKRIKGGYGIIDMSFKMMTDSMFHSTLTSN